MTGSKKRRFVAATPIERKRQNIEYDYDALITKIADLNLGSNKKIEQIHDSVQDALDRQNTSVQTKLDTQDKVIQDLRRQVLSLEKRLDRLLSSGSGSERVWDDCSYIS